MKINIRKVNVSDWEKLKKLLIEVVAEKPPVALELEPLIHKEDRWIAEFPTKDRGQFIVAELNTKSTDKTYDQENSGGEIIGFAYLAAPRYYEMVAYIGIVVKKEYRRKNLGTRLFYNLAEWAATKNLTYIIADIWSWNLKSIKFFEGLGFKEKNRFSDRFKGEEKEKVRMIKRV
jgi:RimJ/RimL family protein N-acetyltransferase